MALRNQKVAISGGGGHVTRVSETVEFPELSEFTLCFEVERNGHKQVRRTDCLPLLAAAVQGSEQEAGSGRTSLCVSRGQCGDPPDCPLPSPFRRSGSSATPTAAARGR